jgi:hypothetical protein
MTHKAPTIEALNAMAKATNDAVRQEAIERGELLPIWKDGRVVLVWPGAPGRLHAVSLGMLVRALIERGVRVSNSDIEAMAVSVPIGDVELILSSDNLQIAEWLTLGPPAGIDQTFRGLTSLKIGDDLFAPAFQRGVWLDDASRAASNLERSVIVRNWATDILKPAPNDQGPPPIPTKARA